MCFKPFISERTCSAGVLTRFSTSSALAPGKGMNILANVTLICGSSSRGVTITAKKPSNKPTNANNGVISVKRKVLAILPEIPIFFSLSFVATALEDEDELEESVMRSFLIEL